MNWELTPPASSTTIDEKPPPKESVLDRLARDLQNGDVALVLTRADLDILTGMVERSWRGSAEWRIFENLKKLKEARR